MSFDRDIFFASVRSSLFAGHMSQEQVDGMNDILTAWETDYESDYPDLRHLAYPLATTYHETSQEMQPIEEYGKGSGMSYGKPDPETGETYYGRGFVQLTWRDNYAKADRELGLNPSCEWDASQQLRTNVAAPTMFIGMIEGWFRASSDGKRQTLARYFDADTDDPYGAREIINGDKTKVPTWSNGVSIGNLIKGYHGKFLSALQASYVEDLPPEPVPEPEPPVTPGMTIGPMVDALWAGQKTARMGWNGKDMYLALQIPDENSKMTLPYVYMKTVQGDLVPWLCSQTDLLAEDWVIVT